MSRNLLLLPSLLLIFGTSITSSIAQITDEEPGLRKLTERMLSIHGDETKVIVGKLPENMPVKLPIPPTSQILGSTVSDKGNIQVVLDIPQSVEQVTDFYKNQLQKSGWKQPKNPYRSGFMTTRSEFGRYANFCNDTIKLMSLQLNITESKVTPTTVSLYLNKINEEDKYNNPCKASSIIDIYENKVQFPVLIPPENAEVSEKERDYSSNDSSLIIETKLDSKTLANHYIQQLEKSGWKRIDSGYSNSYTWSTWTFKDETGKNWQGVMSFTRTEGKTNHYFANLKAF
jgi:hypothetical protein